MYNGIKLFFKGVSQVVGSSEVSLLVLVNEEENRQLAILSDKLIWQQLQMRVQNKHINWDIRMPEVFAQLLSQSEAKFELNILGFTEGIYHASIVNVESGEAVPVKCSDGIFIAMVSHMPIYVDKDLLKRQGSSFSATSQKIALPINAIPDTLIQKSLDEAIRDENYELASNLRDELRKRHADEADGDTPSAKS